MPRPSHQIWLKRCGYAFQHFAATRPDREAELKARVEQVHRFLIEQFKDGRRYTQNMLQDIDLMEARICASRWPRCSPRGAWLMPRYRSGRPHGARDISAPRCRCRHEPQSPARRRAAI